MKTNVSSYILRTVGLTTVVLVVGLPRAVFATSYKYTPIDFPGRDHTDLPAVAYLFLVKCDER